MSKAISLDLSKTKPYLGEHEVASLQPMITAAHEMLHKGTGEGSEFLGWVDLPVNYDKEEFARIKKSAEKIKSDSDVLIVIGIGGSYLGARAAIEMLSHTFYNNVSKETRKTPEIYYVGNNISSTYMADLIEAIDGKDFSINVISKSGTTTEPAIAFRIFRELIEKKIWRRRSKKENIRYN